ncbi:MAG: ECF transporter S component [Lachnospiraceae bacterium]|nr:ECF transporter S component [Lachnospiraceae bacterium]
MGKEYRSRRIFDEASFLKNIQKRRVMAIVLIVFILPVLFGFFYFFMKQKHYILMSLLVLTVVIMPFLLVFEYKKPRARDVVLTSSMTAFTVVGNVICTHTIPLHAGTALVVISGISLGPETGFLVGALGRMVCNIFDGQGPWTPWQMVCWGLIGFMSGLAFNRIDIRSDSLFEESTGKTVDSFKIIMGPIISIIVSEMLGFMIYVLSHGADTITGFVGWWLYGFGALGLVAGVLLQRKKLHADVVTMTAFTFFISFIIYGGIMNFASLLMDAGMNPDVQTVSARTIRLVYITGVPYDLQHGAGAAVCIFFFGESLIKKIQRIKIKYGII